MAKPKSPLLSLGARGTIGDALTYQKRGREHIVREKPIPTDPYSLAQAYQRWDYRDYAYLWTLLSNAEKQVYRTKASRYHITGFSQWMKERLKELPNLIGRWHLDELGGATAYDSSKQGNNGTIFGASPATGVIDGAYSFDGVNDYINCGSDPSLNMNMKSHSFEFFIKTTDTLTHLILQNRISNWYIQLLTGRPYIKNRDHLGNRKDSFFTAEIVNDGIWHHVVFTVDRINKVVQGYKDGQAVAISGSNIAAITGNLLYTGAFYIGSSPEVPIDGLIDEVTFYDSLLDTTLIKRHSERRYSL